MSLEVEVVFLKCLEIKSWFVAYVEIAPKDSTVKDVGIFSSVLVFLTFVRFKENLAYLANFKDLCFYYI